ncbi:hypothetical protein GCM10028807_59490 [Spirosoma daeguense]
MTSVTGTDATEQFLAGGGEMGKLIRSMDWSKTPLGPVESWPQSLRTSVSLCLSSTFPILIAWGPETIQIYNDSYRPICGAKHPESMGQNFRICWETALPVVGDAFSRGEQGEGTYIKDQRMFLDRFGYLEEAFMTFSFAPIRDESGGVGGIFHPITETTDKMLSARRTQVLRDVAALTGDAKLNETIYSNFTASHADFTLDLPFLLFYEFQNDGQRAKLVNAEGLAEGESIPTHLLDIDVVATDWLSDVSKLTIVEDLAHRFAEIPSGPYPEFPHTAVILPIQISTKEQPFGFIMAGVSPCRALDTDYLNFYSLLGNTISTAFSNVYAYQEEQKRAEALAAIDQAKTAFFSNISHEFRTPLTLMLGPLEELLYDENIRQSDHKESIKTTHRNAKRLLKLVNNLLDFSRIEANRVQAQFRPVDLVGLTTDLASSFRSLIEKAGLQFIVDCQSLPSAVYADAEMWEKIVLNLLSNAFKYTLKGSIRIELKAQQDQAILRVSDTGVGIPANELPHMFERFHRVENSGGRTHEGSGIGLSLVNELIQLHKGSIRVGSVEGEGTTFTVSMPLGNTHITTPLYSINEQKERNNALADAFLMEAQSMLPNDERFSAEGEIVPESVFVSESSKETSVLIVDDNNDMRAYLGRLLEPHFIVRDAINGVDALQKIAQNHPDLILSDIMMPVMDGKELLKQVKASPDTARIPLIFLSARAGQESRIDGLEAGADDYLVKPFSAQELLTKVRTQVVLAKSRHYEETRLRNLVQQAPVAMLLVKGEALTIELINQAFLDLIDKQADILGQPLLTIIPELERQNVVEQCIDVLKTGESYQSTAVEIPVRRNGHLENGYFNVFYTPYYEGDMRTGVLQVVTDVTEQVLASKRTEESENRYRQLATELDLRVEQRTKSLEEANADLLRSNKNLEQFAYVASHDLQEPLRKIQSFSTIMQEQYGTMLPEEGNDYLRRMQVAGSRMSTLIKDLLAYSRISTRQAPVAPVPLSLVLENVTQNLSMMVDETQAEITIGSLPVVQGDRLQLEQLFQNLLSNALKFRRPDAYPQIQVTTYQLNAADLPDSIRPTRVASSYYRIDVADNGIGFDQKYTERIFQVFQRLHNKNTYEGTGIGLAICEKVVANHGGAITATSTLGEGATFSVYLPVDSDS